MVAGKLKAYKIKLTPVAEGTYRKFAESAAGPIERGELGHAAVKRMRLVDECLDVLIPHAPFSTDRALVGALSNIFRVKKGRIRICYIASSAKFEITILYISETLRKDGDRSDPYAIFGSMVRSSKFDEFFAALGVKTPKSSAGQLGSRSALPGQLSARLPASFPLRAFSGHALWPQFSGALSGPAVLIHPAA